MAVLDTFMLHSYKFKNFSSFAAETEVSLSLSPQVPSSDLSFESPAGVVLSKVVAVIGPNSSGKTSLLKSLAFLNWFAAHSFTDSKPEANIPVVAHFFSDESDSEFEIEFENRGQQYRYSLVVNPRRVMHESLHLKTSKFYSYLFRRDWSEKEDKYHIRQKNFGFAASEAAKVRVNASMLSTAAQYDVPSARVLVDYFNQWTSNIASDIVIDPLNFGSLLGTADFFHGRPALRAQMSKLLSQLDLGLSKVVIDSRKVVTEDSGKNDVLNSPFGVHKLGDREQQLPFWKESSGTQAAFILLGKILPALEQGGVVIIDELEANLHSDMITAILDLFIEPEHNPHNTQIIFTCHAHEILNVLQKEQILLVEKDSNGFSEAWRLSDMKGTRRDDNLYAKYRAGAYGAVPNF